MFGIDEIGVQIEEPFGCGACCPLPGPAPLGPLIATWADGGWAGRYLNNPAATAKTASHRKPCPPPRSILPLEAAGATIERNIRELLSRNYEVGRGGAASLKLALVSLHGLQIHHPCASKMVRRPA